jgi:hypothetical protein
MIAAGQLHPETVLRLQTRAADGTLSAPLELDWLFHNFDTGHNIYIELGALNVMLSIVPRASELGATSFGQSVIAQRERPEGVLTGMRVLRSGLGSGADEATANLTYEYVLRDDGEVFIQPPTGHLPPARLLVAPRRLDPAELAAQYSAFVQRGRRDDVIDLMQCFDPRVQGVELLTVKDVPLLHVDVGLGKSVPVTALGEGILSATALLLAVGGAAGGLVLVDEVDAGWHYSTLTHVWRVLDDAARAFDVQVFATTHSFECVRAAHDVLPDDLRVYRFERGELGGITPHTYARDELLQHLAGHFDVR